MKKAPLAIQAFNMLTAFTILTGLFYPLVVLIYAQLMTPHKANGSLMYSHESSNARPIGSLLIAQKFESDIYFWPRPSSIDYQPFPSKGRDLARTSKELSLFVQNRAFYLAEIHHSTPDQVPLDLLFNSASGIDPHISLQAVYYQLDRVLEKRKINSTEIRREVIQLIQSLTEGRTVWILGPSYKYVNVLQLNLALDELLRSRVNE